MLLAFATLATDVGAARHGTRQLYGAIAYSSKTGSFGYAVDQRTKRDAETEAFRECGPECDIIKAFRDTCGAVANKGRQFSWDTGSSREIAEMKARKKCGGEACKVLVWACTSQKK